MKKMLNVLFVVAVITFTVTTVWADTVAPVAQCAGESFDHLQDRIQIIPCGKTRCKLQKTTNVTVKFRFEAKKEIESLNNLVYGAVGGVPLPFLGVTGTSACENVIHAETGAPATCPLAPGHEYVYTNVFYVDPIYPTISLRVHWHLHDGDDKVICFEVPAIIVANSNKKSLF